MPKFTIELTAIAYVTTTVVVDAPVRYEAEEAALKQADEGNVVWKYDGLVPEDDNIEITSVLQDNRYNEV